MIEAQFHRIHSQLWEIVEMDKKDNRSSIL